MDPLVPHSSPVAEARLHGLPKILCIANWRVVRQGLGQRVGKALHPVCCQESVGELGNGIAVAGQVGWVVLQRVTRVQPIDGDGWVRIEVEKIGRHVCDNVEIVDDAIARARARCGVNHIAIGGVAHAGTAERDQA